MTCWTYRNKLKISFTFMIILSFLLIIAKIIIGYKEHSLSLVADSFHLILDVPALIIGFLALKFAREEVDDGKFTFGRIRAEILGAMVNAIFLVAICFSLAVESVKHLFVPHEMENPLPVLIIGIISLVVNMIGLFLFRWGSSCSRKREEDKGSQNLKLNIGHGSVEVCQSALSEDKKTHSRRSKIVTPPNLLNIHGVFLHILQHAFIASIVITSALVVMYAKGKWTLYVDPCLSLALVIFLLKSLFPLLQECLATLMQSVPADLQLQNVEERLVTCVPEVADVHELHIWQLAGDEVVGSAHIVFRSYKVYNQHAINSIQEFFAREGISSLTIQPEFTDYANNNDRDDEELSTSDSCMLKCAEKKCAHLTCCETPDKIIAELHHQH